MAELQRTNAQAAHILVVDDDTSSLRLLAEILARAGHRVRPVERPQVALEAARAHPPSLILLDARMPDMSGFELCRRLKQDDRTSQTPIILLISLQDVDGRGQVFEAGGSDFIAKPVQEPEVLARVRTHLELCSIQLHLEERVTERTAALQEANEVLEVEIQERKRAQQALVESERPYRAVVEQASEGILVLQERQRKYCNPTWLEMTGYTAEEYASIPFLSLVYADDLGAVESAYQDLLNGQAFGPLPEFRITTQSGDIKWLAARGSRIDWEGRPAGWVFIQDITDRKQALLALQASEERYRSLVERARDGIVVIQKGLIKYANSYVAELAGRTVSELLGTPFEAYLAADQLPKVADMYRRRMNGQAVPSVYESALQHKDGSRVEVEFNADLTTYDGRPADLVIVRDIRKRKRAQRELQESQRLLGLVIDNVPALVSYVDRERRYRFVNQRYEQVYGLPRSQFAGRHVREILGPEGYAAVEPRIAAVLAGKEISYEDVFEYPEGGQRWMAVNYVPDRDPAGEVQGFVAMVTDITERKQAEQALRTSEAHLRRAQEVARAGSWELDLVSGRLFWSDEVYRIFGLSAEIPLDYERFLGCLLPEDRGYVDASWRAALEGAPYDIEHRIAVGEVVKWVREKAEIEFDETGRAVRGLGIVQDITAHKQVEQELRKGKERLQEAQKTAQIGDWEYDIRTGQITWSAEMYRIFGLDAGHYVPNAKSDEEFCHPDDAPALRRAYERFFASGRDMDAEYRIVTPQGAVKHCRIRGRLILDQAGIPRLAIGTTEDITTRKLVEQQVIAYQERLKDSASELTLAEERERRRIAAELHDQVGQTLALVRIQLAAASRASSDVRLVARLDEASESVRNAIQDTRELVFDLSPPLLNEIGLGAAVAEWLEAEIGGKHDLQTEYVDDGQEKPLDEDVRAILYRNVRELLTNVVRHARARQVSVRMERAGDQVVVVVRDDGVGFDAHAISGTARRDGGFGLFSIQERMADLGGSLEIVSAPGQGCTATLTAPLKLRQSAERE